MNLYFRLLIILFKIVANEAKKYPLDEIICSFRVLPNDLDINLHMNNGRYLTIMDLARIDFMRQTGILLPAIKKKWFPILGATQMKYLRPLKAFQKYTLKTKVEYLDEKWFVMSQRFESKGKLIALGRIRGLMRGPNGNVPPKDVLALSSFDVDADSLTLISKEISEWLQAIDLQEK